MKKLSLSILFVAIILGVTGCGNNNPNTPITKKINGTKKFRFTNAKLNLSQLVKTKIVYHTQKELETIFNNKLTKLLKNNKLLSKNTKMNKLVINANYQRRFVGDETPLSTDSLAYPNYSYTIDVINKNKSIGIIKQNKLTFVGGFSMNLQIIAGTLRDKKYELEFIDALANKVFEDIKNIN
jgi:hypothetical protein